jgi:hypothetical protein
MLWSVIGEMEKALEGTTRERGGFSIHTKVCLSTNTPFVPHTSAVILVFDGYWRNVVVGILRRD